MSFIHLIRSHRRALAATLLAGGLFAAAPGVRAQAPDMQENFTAFNGLTGAANANAASDYGTGLFLISATSTPAGFASVLRTGAHADNKAFGYDSRNETGFVITDSSFTGFSQQTFMVALRFYYSGTTIAANNRGPIFMMYQAGASFPVFVFRVGTDGSSVLGVSPTVTTGGTPSAPTYGSFSSTAAAENTWHTLVIHYTNASTSSATDGQITWWLNPVTVASPGSQSLNRGTFSGPAPVSDWGLAGNFFSANTGRPTDVRIDSIGIWDGFGTAGDNSLQEALDFLSATVPVELTAISLD